MQTAQTIYSYTHKMSCVTKFLLFVLQHAPGADSMLNALYSMEISYVPGIIFLYISILIVKHSIGSLFYLTNISKKQNFCPLDYSFEVPD